MKKLFFSLILLFTLISIQAQTKLNVLLNDGSTKGFDLLTGKLTFTNDDKMIVWNNNLISSTLPLNSVRKVYFGNFTDDVVQANSNTLKMYYFDGTVFISGFQSNQKLTVTMFDSKGNLIRNLTMSHNGTINVNNLNHGIYIVRIGNRVLKFVK